MEFRTESRTGPVVGSMPQVVAEIGKELTVQPQVWLQQLLAHPERFADLEVQVHDAFQGMADQLVAGLLAEAGRQPQLAERAKKK
jgi:hypothetical protein